MAAKAQTPPAADSAVDLPPPAAGGSYVITNGELVRLHRTAERAPGERPQEPAPEEVAGESLAPAPQEV